MATDWLPGIPELLQSPGQAGQIEPLSPLAPLAPHERAALQERLLSVRSQIAAAARAAGRQPQEITLIGVSKMFPASLALAAAELGLADLGENRVQEMLGKIDQLAAAGQHPNWHLIGTLQKNKVRQIIGRTHLIHSVDSIALLQEINRRSEEKAQTTDLLLQVNTAGEATKHGFAPGDLAAAVDCALQLRGIRLRGLMAIAPLFEDPEATLPVFSQTRQLFSDLAVLANQAGGAADFTILSMGMSHDYRQAITCGATHVRIGTAIFGRRL